MTIADIANITIPYEFGCDNYNDVESDAIEDVIYQLDNFKNEYTYEYGASKFVLLPEGEDYVIKIPFNGSFNYDDEDDEYVFTHYCTSDYCAIEADIYEKAEAEGVELFFAKTEYAGRTKSGVPFYISERAAECGNDYYDSSDNSKEIVQNSAKFYSEGLHSDFVAAAIDSYGEELTLKFIDFIEKYDIRDLHRGNLGLNKDGKVIIIDYSGFDW